MLIRKRLVNVNRQFGKHVPDQKPVVLGRSSSSLKIGIVGMANIGKSSTFNLLSNLNVPVQNRPFCTIQPNSAIVPVPDPRFDYLVKQYKPKKQSPPLLRIIDIAGLVKGASEGYGLGNQFLSHMKQVDAMFHVVRCFEGGDVTHTQGTVSPIRDIEIIYHELCAKDLKQAQKVQEDMLKKYNRNQSVELKVDIQILENTIKVLKQDKLVVNQIWSDRQKQTLNKLNLLTAKPILTCLNSNKLLQTTVAQQIQQKYPSKVFLYSVQQEEAHKVEHGRVSDRVVQLIRKGYELLGLIHFFTVGEDEVKCWTLRKGSSVVDAAGLIHSELAKGFLSAQVECFAGMKPSASEKQGKSYKIRDGDIITINSKYKR